MVAGIESCTTGYLGDGGPPDQTCFGSVGDVYVDTNEVIWVADVDAARVRRITQALPNFPSGEISIASEDGAVVDMFNDHGRHLRTVDALTGLTLLSFSYDSAGHLTALKDRDGNTTSIAYDDKGTPTTITTPFGQNTSLVINSDGYLSSVTNPNNETESLTYAGGGLLSTLTEPRGSQDTHYTYNADDQIASVTEPDGSIISPTYDATSGRINQLSFADGSISYAYSGTTGQLTGITAPDATTSYSYHGNLLAGVSWSGPFSAAYGQSINNDLQVTSDTAAGSGITYTYDQDDLVLTAGSETLTRDAQTPLITGTTLGSAVDVYSYDNFGDLAGYQATFGSNALYDVQLTRDDLGRIVTRDETIQGESHKDTYTYDARGRLSQVTRDDTVVAAYTYDANNNRTSVATTNTSENATFDAQDRLLTVDSTSCTYSPNGIGLGLFWDRDAQSGDLRIGTYSRIGWNAGVGNGWGMGVEVGNFDSFQGFSGYGAGYLASTPLIGASWSHSEMNGSGNDRTVSLAYGVGGGYRAGGEFTFTQTGGVHWSNRDDDWLPF